MILDLNAIKRSGKTRSEFSFGYETDVSVDLPEAKILSPVAVRGEAILTGENTADVVGEAVFTISGACTRCLKPTEKTFKAEFSESCGNGDGAYPVKNGKIDLKKIIDDVIILNTPLSFLCNEGCKGICAGCGVNLNDGECKCNN